MPEGLAAAMRSVLPSVAERTVAAIVVEVPAYTEVFTGGTGRKLETAVRLALGGFLELTSGAGGVVASTPMVPSLDGAYELGVGEARSGRSMDALQAAYRVGARIAWRELSTIATSGDLSPDGMARFAGLLFAYIDQLSAISVAGHADGLATTGRARQQYLDRLAYGLLTGSGPDELVVAADRAGWEPPRSLTAVIIPEARARGVLARLDPRTLQTFEGAPDLPDGRTAVLLVPDAEGPFRASLVAGLAGLGAVLGPARPWTGVRASYLRAQQAARLDLRPTAETTLDTEQCLADLVLRSDPDALDDLRAQVLAPLDGLRAPQRAKLEETLRSWLLHHGRREEIAAELFVHPQTVRYRMGQLRELYGSRLDDPRTVLELTVALGSG
ncbi:helix-turn-helix domain-containing protein [Actinokineospora sp. PR83]|uniref:PucR family transcriptional regulator n=1 Tax=Actinokineospora sp. PR83 TaxID=2884908 RepID=UPI001F39BAF9|nr:helix-turn-helix domain-containing protein [Actinokineospora sp. PR83]MCG8916499.1 helix-turn-helix domain-containing protein [Actinokineospora sp. PR83]